MDEKERKVKYDIKTSEEFEKRDHILNIIQMVMGIGIVICLLLVSIGMMFSLDLLMIIAFWISTISIIVLTIDLIQGYIYNYKTNKKWDKYIEEIGKL